MNDVLTQDFNVGNMLLNVVALISSAIVVVGTVSTHAKRIALKDIKNPALKRSLVRAGLYFNKDGKLVKRLEEAAKIDIDGDNKIGDVDIEDLPKENLLQGLKRSGKEFATIMTFKPGKLEDADKLIEENGLAETAVALQEIDESIKQSKEEFTLEDAAETAVAAKEFLESDEGQVLQAKTAEVIEDAGNTISAASVKTGSFFKKAATATGHGFMTGLKFVGNGLAKGGKAVFIGGSAAGSWVKNGVISIASAVGGFFKNIFAKKQNNEQDEALAKMLASKKIEKEQIQKEEIVEIKEEQVQEIKTEEPKVEPQTKTVTAAPTVKKANPKVDPLEALRQKYGR
jgi:ribosomal protein L20A (L18A)